MIAQFYKFTTNHWIVQLQWMNVRVDKLYFDKAVKGHVLENGG